MKKSLGMTILFVFLAVSFPDAGELPQSQFDLTIASLKGAGTTSLYNQAFLAQTDEEFETPPETEPPKKAEIFKYSYKSPKKAFLLSLLVPGLGQLYNGSNIMKTAAFLLAEGGAWAGHFKYHGDGEDKTDAFHLFADTHWFEGDTTRHVDDTIQYQHLENETYRGWLLQNEGDVADTSTPSNNFTHTLPSSKDQQYYEMIGKYDQFRGGWDDYWADTTIYLTPNREQYENMRKAANDDLDKANNMIYLAMAVHLISAVDAAISANRHNNKSSGDNWSVKTEMRYYSATEQIPVIKFTRKF